MPVVNSSNSDLQQRFISGEKAAIVRVKFAGANTSSRITGLEVLETSTNYFVSRDKKEWRSRIPNYARVKYEEIYRGIDLVYYGSQRQLEYDLRLAPGADPKQIKLSFEGADKVSIDDSGDLVITTPVGEIRQRPPTVYQEYAAEHNDIATRYVVIDNDKIGFEIVGYDPSKTVIVDPVLAYSTYLGGNGPDEGVSIAVDSSGNAYVTGTTRSMNFPTTPGAFQTVPAPFVSVFVSKINSSGSALVYSTYLGQGEASGIAIDSSGAAYVAGVAADIFPVTAGAFDTTYNGGGDTFVTKIDASGASLIYSTYLGGADGDHCKGIALDSSGQAFVTGFTISSNFPITPTAFQTVFRGGSDRGCEWGDGYVTKLNSAGSGLIYSTFLGGDLSDGCFAVAVDSSGDAYVTGTTHSQNFPTTPASFQSSHSPCTPFNCSSCLCEDAFITKLNPDGSALVYSTFLGGSVCDIGLGIAVDPSGSAHVTGRTNSPNFPTLNPIQSSFGGFRDVFITRVNASGSALIYSTYFGGNEDDQGLGIAVDLDGSTYVVGVTDQKFFPQGSAFIAKLNPAGSSYNYFLKIGDSNQGGGSGNGIAVDSVGKAYVTGSAATGFPVTSGAFQTVFGGGESDVFVAKIDNTFDMCLQDDASGSSVSFNLTTGDYQFTNCGSVLLYGSAAIIKRGCLVTLQVSGPDRRLLARVDTCSRTGTATVQALSQGLTFTIMDRNTNNNTCTCLR